MWGKENSSKRTYGVNDDPYQMSCMAHTVTVNDTRSLKHLAPHIVAHAVHTWDMGAAAQAWRTAPSTSPAAPPVAPHKRHQSHTAPHASPACRRCGSKPGAPRPSQRWWCPSPPPEAPHKRGWPHTFPHAPPATCAGFGAWGEIHPRSRFRTAA